jgi:hypothetical protein
MLRDRCLEAQVSRPGSPGDLHRVPAVDPESLEDAGQDRGDQEEGWFFPSGSPADMQDFGTGERHAALGQRSGAGATGRQGSDQLLPGLCGQGDSPDKAGTGALAGSSGSRSRPGGLLPPGSVRGVLKG